jgi:hypothetical protein
LAGANINLAAPIDWTHFFEGDSAIDWVTRNPGAVARYFNAVAMSFFDVVVPSGLFGKVRGHIGVVETSHRGPPHLHVVLFCGEVVGNCVAFHQRCGADAAYCAKVLRYLSSVVIETLPELADNRDAHAMNLVAMRDQALYSLKRDDGDADDAEASAALLRWSTGELARLRGEAAAASTDTSADPYRTAAPAACFRASRVPADHLTLHRLVLASQAHRHTFSCWKKAGAVFGNEDDCRFHMPRPSVAEAHYDAQERQFHLRRSDGSR